MLLLVVLDGAGDLPCKELGGRTPLQAAHMPSLSSLPKTLGMLSIAGKIAPESDTGVFSVLGFDPFKYKPGRGSLEAIGAGLELTKDCVALRANFATVKDGKITDRRAGRITTQDAKKLEEKINKGVMLSEKFAFKATAGHRGVLVLYGSDLSSQVSNTDPAYSKEGSLSNANADFSSQTIPCKALSKNAEKTAALVNEFISKASSVLSGEKANFILLRGADYRPEKPPWLMKDWTIIADMPLEIGIGKLLGMQVISLKNTNNCPAGYEESAGLAMQALKNKNVYVHIKGPDLFGHDGDALGKKKCLEEIDKHFFGNIKHDKIAVTADHATPCPLKGHSNDAVPFCITGKGDKTKFAENASAPIKAQELMKIFQG